MRITAIPREDMNSVSTRIHYYAYLNNLPEGFSWERHRGEFGDVLYVQKAADDRTIKIARKAKRIGVPVVYDCDDNPYERPGKRRVTMLRLADAVTCDTDSRGVQIKRASGIAHVFVIPECLDYFDDLRLIKIREEMRTMITFGNNANAVNTRPYYRAVGLKKRYINGKKIDGLGKFVKWNRRTFVDEMHKADVCMLIHKDNLKSNLKLLVCIALGIPTIVSDTRHYRAVLDAMDLGWMAVSEPADVPAVLRLLESRRARLEVAAKYYTYDLTEHFPGVAAGRLAEVFRSVYARPC